MAEEKKNAQVINGVNDDIAELKSLSSARWKSKALIRSRRAG